MEKETYRLIEAAAEQLAKKILLKFPLVKKVEVEIKKPWAPILLPLDTVSVNITRGWETAYLSIGSNMGDRKAYLEAAIEELKKVETIREIKVSEIIETEPYGYTDQDKFLNALPGKRVLDFGCGSGRDTKYFLGNGLAVTAMDGSEELCKYASAYTGIPVKNMIFQDLDEMNQYDGIWACSSILHLPKKELKMVFHKMVTALDTNGIIYTSFKYGTFEGERNGRFFTDFTPDTFSDFIKDVEQIRIEEEWLTDDVRPGREKVKWLNLILKKTGF